MDGTYITQPWLVVNGTGQSSNISVITGTNRDEAGVLIDDYPATAPRSTPTPRRRWRATTSRRRSCAGCRSRPSAAAAPETRRRPSSTQPCPSPPAASSSASTLAKAYSAARHGAWKRVFAYQFNRTYQTAGYSKPWCVPAASPSRPQGDPDAEYFKLPCGRAARGLWQRAACGTARQGRPRRGIHPPHRRPVGGLCAHRRPEPGPGLAGGAGASTRRLPTCAPQARGSPSRPTGPACVSCSGTRGRQPSAPGPPPRAALRWGSRSTCWRSNKSTLCCSAKRRSRRGPRAAVCTDVHGDRSLAHDGNVLM